MTALHDGVKMRGVQMRINLCGRNIRVAEELLDNAEIRSTG